MRAEKDFEDLLKTLNANDVKYCIVGAYAVMYYTRPRFTDDLDILIQSTPENAQKVVKTIEDFGFTGTGVKPEDFLDRKKIFELGKVPVMIHLTTKIDGLADEEIWNNLEKGKYGNTPTYYIGLTQLKKNKAVVAEKRYRSKDKDDYKNLVAIKSVNKKVKNNDAVFEL